MLLTQSCKQKKQTESGKVTVEKSEQKYKSEKANTFVSGFIENATRDFIVLSQEGFNDTIELKSDGTFHISLHLKNAEYFLLRDGKSNIRLFLEPLYKLEIKYNATKTFGSIEFNGNGKEANSYLKDKYLLMLNNTISLSQLYAMSVKEFRFQIDSMFVISKMFYNKAVDSLELPELFKETELACLKYERATKLLEYFTNSNAPLGNNIEYLKFLNNLSVNKEKHLSIYEYRSFLNAFIDFKAHDRINAKNLEAYEIALIKMQTVNANISSQAVKDFLLYTNLKQFVKYYGYKNAELLFKTFELNCKTPEYLNTAMSSYNAYKQLSEVKPATNFKMENVNGQKFSLNDFKGSYVYVDVWASWCLPCRKEAPIFEKLKHEYSHKNVAFLSVSIDKTKEEWLNYLNNKNIDTDMHFLVKDKKSFLDNYMIQTIPHFLIIDDKGNLIDNNAPRPSEGKTDWLEKLTEKPSV